jgi:hypothetical protein
MRSLKIWRGIFHRDFNLKIKKRSNENANLSVNLIQEELEKKNAEIVRCRTEFKQNTEMYENRLAELRAEIKRLTDPPPAPALPDFRLSRTIKAEQVEPDLLNKTKGYDFLDIYFTPVFSRFFRIFSGYF